MAAAKTKEVLIQYDTKSKQFKVLYTPRMSRTLVSELLLCAAASYHGMRGLRLPNPCDCDLHPADKITGALSVFILPECEDKFSFSYDYLTDEKGRTKMPWLLVREALTDLIERIDNGAMVGQTAFVDFHPENVEK